MAHNGDLGTGESRRGHLDTCPSQTQLKFLNFEDEFMCMQLDSTHRVLFFCDTAVIRGYFACDAAEKKYFTH